MIETAAAKKVGNFLILFKEEVVEIAYFKRVPTLLSTAIETQRFQPLFEPAGGWVDLVYQDHIYPALRFNIKNFSQEEAERLILEKIS